MAAPLQIRNVSDRTRGVLKKRAAERGDSLNTYLLELLDRTAAQPTAAEVFARVARRSGRSSVSAVDIVRADRDGRRRA